MSLSATVNLGDVPNWIQGIAMMSAVVVAIFALPKLDRLQQRLLHMQTALTEAMLGTQSGRPEHYSFEVVLHPDLDKVGVEVYSRSLFPISDILVTVKDPNDPNGASSQWGTGRIPEVAKDEGKTVSIDRTPPCTAVAESVAQVHLLISFATHRGVRMTWDGATRRCVVAASSSVFTVSTGSVVDTSESEATAGGAVGVVSPSVDSPTG